MSYWTVQVSADVLVSRLLLPASPSHFFSQLARVARTEAEAGGHALSLDRDADARDATAEAGIDPSQARLFRQTFRLAGFAKSPQQLREIGQDMLAMAAEQLESSAGEGHGGGAGFTFMNFARPTTGRALPRSASPAMSALTDCTAEVQVQVSPGAHVSMKDMKRELARQPDVKYVHLGRVPGDRDSYVVTLRLRTPIVGVTQARVQLMVESAAIVAAPGTVWPVVIREVSPASFSMERGGGSSITMVRPSPPDATTPTRSPR